MAVVAVKRCRLITEYREAPEGSKYRTLAWLDAADGRGDFACVRLRVTALARWTFDESQTGWGRIRRWKTGKDGRKAAVGARLEEA